MNVIGVADLNTGVKMYEIRVGMKPTVVSVSDIEVKMNETNLLYPDIDAKMIVTFHFEPDTDGKMVDNEGERAPHGQNLGDGFIGGGDCVEK